MCQMRSEVVNITPETLDFTAFFGFFDLDKTGMRYYKYV